MKEKIILYKKDGKYYATFGNKPLGAREDYRPLILRISEELVKFDKKGNPFITLPMKGVQLRREELSLIPTLIEGNLNLFNIFVKCGAYGESFIKILSEHQESLKYFEFGSHYKEVSEGYLVFTRENYVKYMWKRTGRLKDDEKRHGLTYIFIDGRREDYEE